MKEHTALCRQIIDYLNTLGHFAWKNQTGIVRKDGCWIQYGYPGSSDIFCILRGGKFLGVEVKIDKDKKREKQKLFEDILHKMGAQYLCVRSFDDFLESFVHDPHSGYKQHSPGNRDYDDIFRE